MPLLTRGEMVRIAIDQYFAEISKDSIPQTLKYFRPDATFTLFPSGRIFSGHAGIAEMYKEVFGRHERIEREIIDIVANPETEMLCASFLATAYPRKGEKTVMHNVNFWKFQGSQFAWVKVYSSDSQL